MDNPKITTTFEQGGELKELFKALIRAQGTMDPVLKDKKNAHFNNAYADINSILETVLPALRGEGVLLTQHIGWSDGCVEPVKASFAGRHPSLYWINDL